jgi:hypothetical protein
MLGCDGSISMFQVLLFHRIRTEIAILPLIPFCRGVVNVKSQEGQRFESKNVLLDGIGMVSLETHQSHPFQMGI